MNREDIISKAKQEDEIELIEFVKLAILEEREACLKAVERSLTHHFIWYPKGYSINANKISDIYKHQHNRCVDAIKARGQV